MDSDDQSDQNFRRDNGWVSKFGHRIQARHQSNRKRSSIDQVGKIGKFLIQARGSSESELAQAMINRSMENVQNRIDKHKCPGFNPLN
jgi:hypothetical protein